MSDFASFFSLTQTSVALRPDEPRDAATSRALMDATLFPGERHNAEMIELCRAGLLLFNDDLEAAHNIVQNIGSASGSFWHAILHRREGDFANANYWWNRTGQHPIFDGLRALALQSAPAFGFLDELRDARTWLPQAFNTWCQHAARTGAFDAELREVQRLEMKLLLEWCAARVK